MALHRTREDWAKEAACLWAVVEARARMLGAGHWRTTDARLMLSEALAQPRRTAAQREALRRGVALRDQGTPSS